MTKPTKPETPELAKAKPKRRKNVTPMDYATRAFKTMVDLEETEQRELARHKERMGNLKMYKETALSELTGEARDLYEALRAAKKGES